MRQFLLLAVVVLAISCEPSLKVSQDFNKDVNFTQYKTFAMYKNDTISTAISQLNRDRIINSIKSEMVKKGFQENPASPDLMVNAVAIFKDRVSVNEYSNYYGYGGFYRPYYWGGAGMYGSSSSSIDIQHYKDGSLIIDIVDTKEKKLVWQGVGNKEIDGPLKNPEKVVPEAVATIMKGFPPGASKK
jgi:hypothetical protein